MCKFVKSGKVVIENIDTFLKEKEVSKRQQRAARYRSRRGTNKRRRNHG
jgi:hypothetical protein